MAGRTEGDPEVKSDSSFQTTPPAVSLSKGGGAIRGMGEKFAANPVTGTGSMSVPIATSPGRSGFGPQLSLSYDSGSGNGPFGFGWSLSLPAISRKTEKGLPQYFDSQESDVFILSGAEDLVPVYRQDVSGTWVADPGHRGYQRDPDGFWVRDPQGRLVVHEDEVDGYRVRRYRPRIEGLFARIERWNKIGSSGDVHWRSISNDNILTLYGLDANSRIADPLDSSRIFTWLICETRDDKGNGILYRYKPEDGLGVDVGQAHERNRGPQDDARRAVNRYLKRIYYGNRGPLLDADGSRPRFLDKAEIETQIADAAWMFEVVFDYGDHDRLAPKPNDPGDWAYRSDSFSSYRSGFEVRTTRVCRRVLMFHHFPGETGVERDCLVRSTDFKYSDEINPTDARNPVYTLLKAVTQAGYRRNNGRYDARSLPPVEFAYTEPIVQEAVEEVDPQCLENLPVGLDGSSYRWTDLHGEGIPGILTEQASAWFYKRNLSPISNTPQFAPIETVALKPNVALNGGAEFMDLAGDGQPDVVVMEGPTPGLYEHDEAEGWQQFRPFTSRLNRDLRNPNLKFVDLDGDGHADVLITEDDAFVWHASLAEEGFGPARRVAQALDEEKGPRIVFADGTQSIYLADFSGDGLTDIVRIRNGEVCFWPNLGYGRFGAKVTMDNSPWFDHPDQFDHKRIRVADIDGSGTTDIIYLHRDGVRLYFNQSGNSWSQPHQLRVFPRVDDVVSILPIDLLGNGTACLVWSSPLPGDARRPMRYVNLMGDRKPHLLIRTINNLGAETRIEYAPSTKFYLQDKRDGKPWITRLPFPVHVVERVETYDHISRNRFVTRYAYHHGYFDGEEREFRGFGMVEQSDTEVFAALSASGELPVGDNVDKASHVPPVRTKSWFHTGAYIGMERISRHFENEYFRESSQALLLPDTVLPAALTVEEEREACRVLKGSMLRQEVYADDAELNATPDEIQRARRPYTVTEQNFTVRTLQAKGGNRHAVFFTHAREAINFHYERNPADPRIQHALTLEVDDFGNVLKSTAIGYGRGQADASLPTDGDRDKQALVHITVTGNTFTNAITDQTDVYRTPLPAEAQTYELRKPRQEKSSGNVAKLYVFEDILNYIGQAGDGNHDIAYEDLAFSDAQQAAANHRAEADKYFRRLVEHVRTLYRPDDCGTAQDNPLTLLPLGKLERLALPGESYRLAFTAGLLTQVFQRPHQGQPDEPLLLPNPAVVLGGTAGDQGGYVDLDVNGNWWIPSGRSFFSTQAADKAATESMQARDHFFLPRRYRDPFGQDSFVKFDNNDLLMVETRDALDNRVTVNVNDYRVLQPRLVSDPNGNRTEVAFDMLGMVAGTAVMGKPSPAPVEGDSLTGFVADLSEAQIDNFFAQPRQARLASAESEAAPIVHTLLANATTRIVYDVDRYQRLGEPPFAATIARETHVSDLQPNQQSKLQVSFSYSDGFGREIQKEIQAESDKRSFADEVLADHPIAYFRLSEAVGALEAVDSSGNGNHAAFSSSGITLQQPGFGAGDTAVLFDGTGSGRIIIPDSQVLNPKHITIEGLFRWSGPVDRTQQRLVEKSFHRGSPTWPTYGLSILPDGSPHVELVITGQSNPVSLTGETKLTPNVATHLAATYDGNAIQIYLNGVLDVSLAIAGEIVSTFGSSDVGIGNQVERERTFNGAIDEMALYDQALSADRIRSHIAKLRPRWVSSGWTIFNNKGKPVRQYEPFFSATHRFQFGATFGVSPVLFYDPAGRVIATLHPNNTYEKVMFDPWQQTTYDVSDTCAPRPALPGNPPPRETGDPRTDPDIGGYVKAYFDAQPGGWQTWYAQRIGGLDTHEQAAAIRAAGHADTPTTAYFDALGRPFLTVARNRVVCAGHDLDGTEESFATRVELDIQGNQREVLDESKLPVNYLPTGALEQRIVMRYAYDMLGNRIYQLSMEAGARWMLNDVAGKPIRAWDSRDHNFTTGYDELRRPVAQTVRGTTADSDPRTLNQDLVVDRIEYGEPSANASQAVKDRAQARNLRTRIYRHFDSAGVAISALLDANGDPLEAYDFKGNLRYNTRRLATLYREIPEWSRDPEAQLDSERFEGSTRYDALNRPIQSIAPHSSLNRSQHPNKLNIIQPVFNEANLLERVDVWLEQATEPAALLDRTNVLPSAVGVENIDYDAKGQRELIEYKNGASTFYTYDPLTFRLTNLLTWRDPAIFTGDDPRPLINGWPGREVQNLHFTYDPAGNITHIQDDAQQAIYFKNKRVEPSNDYTYDAIYRLIQAIGREHLGQVGGAPIPHSYNDADRTGLVSADAAGRFAPNDGRAMGTYTERYVYDAVGNFLQMQHRGDDPANAGWRRVYDYREPSLLERGKQSNRLTRTTMSPADNTPQPEAYLHDAHGNMTSMQHLPLMQWDYRDQLQATAQQVINGIPETTYYVYDAAGQRVRKVTESAVAAQDVAGGKKPARLKERVYLGGFEIYREFDTNGTAVALERETLHVMDDKQRIVLVETRTDTQVPLQLIRYQLGNHLGSASLELDERAEIISYEEYAPYGSTTYQAVRSQTESAKRYRYTGKERDEESGLNYHVARYYIPWLGRWLRCDPKGVSAGLNVYAYCKSSPLMFDDRNGMQEERASGIHWKVEFERVTCFTSGECMRDPDDPGPPRDEPTAAQQAEQRAALLKRYPYPLKTDEFMKSVLRLYPLRKGQWLSDVPAEFTDRPGGGIPTEYYTGDPDMWEFVGTPPKGNKTNIEWEFRSGWWYLPEHSEWYQTRTTETQNYPLDAPLRQTPLSQEVLDSLRSDIPEFEKPAQTGFGQFDVDLSRLEQKIGGFLKTARARLESKPSGISFPFVASLDKTERQSREPGSSQPELPPPPATPRFDKGLGLNYDVTRGSADVGFSVGATVFEKTYSYSQTSQSLTSSDFDIRAYSFAGWVQFRIGFGR